MRIIIILLVMSFALPCYAVNLYRYTDKATGEEKGICYGSIPPIDNPDWEAEIIDEKLKKHYIVKQNKQFRIKDKERKEKQKQKKNKAVKELENLGISSETIESILN